MPKGEIKLYVATLVIGAFLGAFIETIFEWSVTFYEKNVMRKNPATITIKDKEQVTVRNKSGKSVGSFHLNSEINEALLANVNDKPNKEIIIGTGKEGQKPGHILFMNTNKKILWEFNAFDKEIMEGLDTSNPYIFTNRFRIKDMELREFPSIQKGQKFLVVNSGDPFFFLRRFIVINPKAKKVIMDIWRPGGNKDLAIKDLNRNGRKTIIIGGINNNLRAYFETEINVPTILMIKAGKNKGQIPPKALPGYQLANPQYFIAFPQLTDTDLKIHEFRDYNKDGSLEFMINHPDCFLYFDNKGTLVNKFIRNKNLGGDIDPMYMTMENGELKAKKEVTKFRQ